MWNKRGLLTFVVSAHFYCVSQSVVEERKVVFFLSMIDQFEFNNFQIREIAYHSKHYYLFSGLNQVAKYDSSTDSTIPLLDTSNWEGEGFITHLSVENDSYNVIHNTDRRFRKYTIQDNREAYSLKPYTRLSNGVYTGENHYIVTHFQEEENDWYYKFSVFDAFSNTTKRSYRINQILKTHYNHTFGEKCMDFVFDGFFTKSDNYTFYVSDKTSLFFAFDNEGKFLFVSEDIKGKVFPKTKYHGFMGWGSCDLNPENRRIRHATNDDNHLYILSNIIDSMSSNLMIDIYLTKSGEYVGSIEVPYLNNDTNLYPNRIKIYENEKISVVYRDNTVVEYKIMRN